MSGKRGARKWLRGHLRDPYVREAGARGYRSRAAWKLAQIDDAERVLRPGTAVVDLGAAPGGWTQVAVERAKGLVLAVDLLPMDAVPGAVFRQGDFTDPDVQEWLEQRLPEGGAGLVMSDMSPNLSGVKAADQARGAALGEAVLDFAARALAPGGAVLMKVFQGAALDALVRESRRRFTRVKLRKPPASRARSSESYLLGWGPVVYSDPD